MGRESCRCRPGPRRSLLSVEELIYFVKGRIGSVKAPKQVDIRPDLPRSKVGKVLKKEIRAKIFRREKDGGLISKASEI